MGKHGHDKRRLLPLLPVLLLVLTVVAQSGAWAAPNQQGTVPEPLPEQVVLDVYGIDPEVLVSQAGDVRIEVPAGAVVPKMDNSNAVTLRYTPEQTTWQAPSADTYEIGHVFSLEVWKWGTAGPWLTGFSFQQPIWVNIDYTGADVTAAAGRPLKIAYNVGEPPYNWVLLSNQTYEAGYDGQWWVKGQIQNLAPSQQTWFALVAPPVLTLTAETAATVTVDSIATKIAIVPVAINAVKDANGNPATIPGLKAYSATASYSSLGIEMKQVSGGSAPFTTVVPNIQATQTTFSGSQTGATPQPPITVANLVPILIGSAEDSYGLTITFNSITDTSNTSIGGGSPVTRSFRRGDANMNGLVNVVDALFIAQYLALRRSVTTINAVNAASPRHDDAPGDKITIVDALFIAQYRANLRNADFTPRF